MDAMNCSNLRKTLAHPPEDAFEVPATQGWCSTQSRERGAYPPFHLNANSVKCTCGTTDGTCHHPLVTPEAPMPSTGPDAAWPDGATVEEAERAYKAINRRDNVRRPAHYAQWKHAPIKFLIENEVNATQFNVIKYVMRYKLKNGVEDLKKSRRYLDMEIKRLEGDPKWSE